MKDGASKDRECSVRYLDSSSGTGEGDAAAETVTDVEPSDIVQGFRVSTYAETAREGQNDTDGIGHRISAFRTTLLAKSAIAGSSSSNKRWHFLNSSIMSIGSHGSFGGTSASRSMGSSSVGSSQQA